MKLSLYFCRHQMGVLERIDKDYIYSSNIDTEESLMKQRFLQLHEYSLWYSQNRHSKELFPEFSSILRAVAKRKDILKRAEITSKDSDWEKLVKLGELRWFPTGFYVQTLNEEKPSPQLVSVQGVT